MHVKMFAACHVTFMKFLMCGSFTVSQYTNSNIIVPVIFFFLVFTFIPQFKFWNPTFWFELSPFKSSSKTNIQHKLRGCDWYCNLYLTNVTIDKERIKHCWFKLWLFQFSFCSNYMKKLFRKIKMDMIQLPIWKKKSVNRQQKLW